METEHLTLPASLLRELPEMTVGERIAAIRQTRGLIKSQLRRRAGIASSTYVYVEKRDAIPQPKHLFNISKVLQVDPILIIKGKNWHLVSPLLKDNEKLFLLRLRNGWTQTELAIVLEKAGLNFQTTIDDSKRATIAQWEIGAAKPMDGKKEIIRKVLADDTLFGKSNPNSQELSPVLKRRAERALRCIQKLDERVKTKDSGREADKRIRFIRLIISDLKVTGAENYARILETSLNRKLGKTADRRKCPNQSPS